MYSGGYANRQHTGLVPSRPSRQALNSQLTTNNSQLYFRGKCMETIEVTSKRYVCRHIHTTGNRCGSPALRGEEFCYYHHATRRGPRPADHDYLCPNSTFDLPSLEDRPSIQLAIAVVARRIALNQIDLQRARLLLYAFRIASTNLPKEPHNAERDKEIEQVEEMQQDPIHGPLAPVAEVVPKEEHKGWAQRLLEELRAREPANSAPNSEPTEESAAEDREEQVSPVEAVLPELQAVAAPLTTHYSQLHLSLPSTQRLSRKVIEAISQQAKHHHAHPIFVEGVR
jgi:hypothetical protein